MSNLNMNLTEALKGGMSPEELTKIFEKELEKAKAETAVPAKTIKVEDARHEFVHAAINYIYAIDLIHKEPTAEDEADLIKLADTLLPDMEKEVVEEYKRYAEIEKRLGITKEDKIQMLKNALEKDKRQPKMVSTNDVISKWLKTL